MYVCVCMYIICMYIYMFVCVRERVCVYIHIHDAIPTHLAPSTKCNPSRTYIYGYTDQLYSEVLEMVAAALDINMYIYLHIWEYTYIYGYTQTSYTPDGRGCLGLKVG